MPDEPCLPLNHTTGLIIFFYVDDFLLFAPPHQLDELIKLKQLLNTKYSIKDLGPANSFLNIQLRRDIASPQGLD
jgi:hypothetical protein